jgi:hypothetical protein
VQLIRFTDKQTGDELQTMTEENYRRNATLPWFKRDMELKNILDAFNETSHTVRGDIIQETTP